MYPQDYKATVIVVQRVCDDVVSDVKDVVEMFPEITRAQKVDLLRHKLIRELERKGINFEFKDDGKFVIIVMRGWIADRFQRDEFKIEVT